MNKFAVALFVIAIIVIVYYIKNKKQYEVVIPTPEGPKVIELPFPKDSIILTPGQILPLSPNLQMEYNSDGSICMTYHYKEKDEKRCDKPFVTEQRTEGPPPFPGTEPPKPPAIPDGAQSFIIVDKFKFDYYLGLPVIGKFQHIPNVRYSIHSAASFMSTRLTLNNLAEGWAAEKNAIQENIYDTFIHALDNNRALDAFRLFKDQ